VRKNDFLWYVGYGSNLCRARFVTYLTGATEDSRFGAHTGAHDQTEPRDSVMVPLAHELYFGEGRNRWKGGTAFIDPAFSRSARTIGRGWLITRGQFEAVAGQENAVMRADVEPLPILGSTLAIDVPGRYELILGLPPIKGHPAFTITSAIRHPQLNPSSAYEAVIVEGLAELGLSEDAIADYMNEHY
jgi:hypothetical protein